MKEINYNKFQYSEFVGEKGQLVFRADTYAELVAQCAEAGIVLLVKTIQPPAMARPVQADPPHPAAQQTQSHFCTQHNKPYEMKTSKFGDFWSHSLGKDASGKWQYCNEK